VLPLPTNKPGGYGADTVRRYATATEFSRSDIGPFFGAFLTFRVWADRFAEITGKIAMWAVLPTVAVGFVNVVLRYTGQFFEIRLTNNSIIELQWYLYSMIFLFGFAYILKHQINVRVDFWFANQPAKRKAWIDFIGHWIGLVPFAIIGMWVSFPQAWESIKVGEGSPDANGLPRGPIKGLLALAFLFLFIQAIAEQVKLYAVLTDRAHMVEIDFDRNQPIRIE